MIQDSISEITSVLTKNKVPFVIIGGLAVSFHGYIRATEDVDIVFMRNEKSEHALFNSLQELEAYWISNEVDPVTNLEKTHPVDLAYVKAKNLMMLGTKFGFLDVFDYVPGFKDMAGSELFKDCIEHDNLKFVSLKWLIRMKEKSGRHKDLDDLENLKLID